MALVYVTGIIGVVTALKLEACGRMYRVVWWQGERRLEDWLLDWEISST